MTRRGSTTPAEVLTILVLGALVYLGMKSIPCGKPSLTGKVTQDLKYLHEVVETYANDHEGRWPVSMDDLVRSEEGNRPYVQQLPLDPWRNAYFIEPSTSPRGRPRVVTLGKDAQRGGQGQDADFDDSMFVVPRGLAVETAR